MRHFEIVDVSRDDRALELQRPYRVIELHDGELRMLHREHRKAHKTIRLLRT
jgi:hypothetical protein